MVRDPSEAFMRGGGRAESGRHRNMEFEKFAIGFDLRDRERLHALWDGILDEEVWSDGPLVRAFEEAWQGWNGLLSWDALWHAVFSRVHLGRATAASIGDVVLVIVGLLLLYVAIRLLREVQFARAQRRAKAEPLAEPPSPGALYDRARAAAGRGEYGAAALLLFTATIALLDNRGDVEVASSATVGDVRRALRARNAPLLSAFDAVAAPFVQAAYAERPIDAAHWDRANEAFEALSRRHPEFVEG